MNSKITSKKIANLASDVLKDDQASKVAKSLAASALSQRNATHQTGTHMEDIASKVLQSEKYADTTKKLAGSVLSQANKNR